MTSIALVGDHTTTTALALAAGWPGRDERAIDGTDREVIIIETDPSGGSLAAWLDTPLSPSLSTAVTALHNDASTGATAATSWKTLDSIVRRASAGVRFLPAPFRAREARSAIAEAARTLLPLVGSVEHTIALLDAGRFDSTSPPAAVRHSEMVLVCHRQDASSAPAATARLERLAESVEVLIGAGHRVGIVLIGAEPFELSEVLAFTAPTCRGWQLAVDPLAAAVFAGRSGVSARRLARLPLARSAGQLAFDLDRMTNDYNGARSNSTGHDVMAS